MTVILFPGLDSSDVLTRFAAMRTELAIPPKRSSAPRSKALKIGDRATFAGSVLRVLPGEDRPLLIMVEATGVKLIINAEHIKGGAKLKGGDSTTLAGTVTRVGTSMVEELALVSMQVDGYSAMRVTLATKSLKRA